MTKNKVPKDFVAEVKVLEEPIGTPIPLGSTVSNLLDTGQFRVLQKILTEIRQENAVKEAPANGKLEVSIDKVAEMEKALVAMKEEILMLTKVQKKPVQNSSTVYLILIGVAIVAGLATFLIFINQREAIDPVIAGGLTFGFTTAIVTMLNNSMQASKALDLQQRTLERQEEADIQRQALLVQSEETLKHTKQTQALVNGGFTEWKETYLKKEYAEGQRAGAIEEQKRADDLKKGE